MDLVVFLLIVGVAGIGGIWLGLRLAPVFLDFGSDGAKEKSKEEDGALAHEPDADPAPPQPAAGGDNAPNAEHSGGTSD